MMLPPAARLRDANLHPHGRARSRSARLRTAPYYTAVDLRSLILLILPHPRCELTRLPGWLAVRWPSPHGVAARDVDVAAHLEGVDEELLRGARCP
jgi:hypothetical protein